MNINPRLSTLPDSPFGKLRSLLTGIEPPQDLSPIMLSVGEPQQPVPTWVGDIIGDNFNSWNKYPPFNGTPQLRQAIAGWLQRRYGLNAGDIEPDQHILPCCGTREALYLLPTWLVPDTKNSHRPVVALPNPYYHAYVMAAQASGAEIFYMPATQDTGFLPDLTTLSRDTLDRLSLFILCTPSNPQGTLADAAYLKSTIQLARDHDFILCVDECYADVYQKTPPVGALQVCREMDGDGADFRNVIVFHSLSKRSNGAGLRSGFFAGDAEIIKEHGRFRLSLIHI